MCEQSGRVVSLPPRPCVTLVSSTILGVAKGDKRRIKQKKKKSSKATGTVEQSVSTNLL